ncbi:MAG TPA: hypothetical protein VGW80_09665 [Solirubrobacterales bacterium]|jgi:hypothetical protein|nr:hypothetical protein [Solirubrobacterales bacterium]
MKHLKMVVTVAMTAMAAFAVLGGSSASATTLEVGGVPKNEAVTIVGSLASGSSLLLTTTDGFFANTCTVFEIAGTAVSPFTATKVTGSGKTLKFGGCTEEPVTADRTGTLVGEHIAGTTNATMFSVGAQVTTPSPFGTLTCTTASSPGTHLGLLKGSATGHATLYINAVINCGFFLPSAKMAGTATVTSPTGVGATA